MVDHRTLKQVLELCEGELRAESDSQTERELVRRGIVAQHQQARKYLRLVRRAQRDAKEQAHEAQA